MSQERQSFVQLVVGDVGAVEAESPPAEWTGHPLDGPLSRGRRARTREASSGMSGSHLAASGKMGRGQLCSFEKQTFHQPTRMSLEGDPPKVPHASLADTQISAQETSSSKASWADPARASGPGDGGSGIL